MNNAVTFESVADFVDKCLELAKAMPDLVNRFEAQAFGAVQFADSIIWQNDPALEKRLFEKWENEWHPMFDSLY